MTRTNKVCVVCSKEFNRTQRLTNHIQSNSECALDMRNVQWLQDNNDTTVLLNIHKQHLPLTSRTINQNKYREVRKILIAVYDTEQARLAETAVSIETLQARILVLEARILVLEAENETLREALATKDQ